MEIKLAVNPDCLRAAEHARLKETLTEVLASCAFRIPQVIVCLEDLDARGHWGWECRIYARLLPSGARAVVGDGNDAETALRGAAEVLARSVGAETDCCPTSGRAGRAGSMKWLGVPCK